MGNGSTDLIDLLARAYLGPRGQRGHRGGGLRPLPPVRERAQRRRAARAHARPHPRPRGHGRAGGRAHPARLRGQPQQPHGHLEHPGRGRKAAGPPAGGRPRWCSTRPTSSTPTTRTTRAASTTCGRRPRGGPAHLLQGLRPGRPARRATPWRARGGGGLGHRARALQHQPGGPGRGPGRSRGPWPPGAEPGAEPRARRRACRGPARARPRRCFPAWPTSSAWTSGRTAPRCTRGSSTGASSCGPCGLTAMPQLAAHLRGHARREREPARSPGRRPRALRRRDGDARATGRAASWWPSTALRGRGSPRPAAPSPLAWATPTWTRAPCIAP